MATGKGSQDRKEIPADSSSGESGSEGSCDKSQEDNEHYVLQERSLPPNQTSGPGGHSHSAMNIDVGGHVEARRSMQTNTLSPTLHTMKDNPVLPTPTLNIGMEYWHGPGATSAVPPEQEILRSQCSALVPPIGTMAFSAPSSDGGSAELWMQDERELKRQKRKQANRESARRSRMRKQAEFDEFAAKVDALTAENNSLKLEMNRLGDLCKKLSSENTALLEKARKLQGGPQQLVAKRDYIRPSGTVPNDEVAHGSNRDLHQEK